MGSPVAKNQALGPAAPDHLPQNKVTVAERQCGKEAISDFQLCPAS